MQDLNSFLTQADEIDGEQLLLNRQIRNMVCELHFVFLDCFEQYKQIKKNRQDDWEIWLNPKQTNGKTQIINKLINKHNLTMLSIMHEYFDLHLKYVNTPVYEVYLQKFSSKPNFIDYAVELPKIKYKILELEVDWYVEHIGKAIEFEQKEHCSSFFKLIQDQDPRLARHTRMVIHHALEQLEIIASKITVSNANEFLINTYSWCLTGMVPLLPEEEQDPFKEIHQRWQKARQKINEYNEQN